METLRFVLAVILMVAVIMVTKVLFPPARAPVGEGVPADTVAAVERERARRAEPGPVEVPTAVAAETVVVESPLYRYGFSTAGGSVVSAELLRYRSMTREGPVQLVAEGLGPLVGYRLRLGSRELDLGALPFRVEGAKEVRLEEGAGPQTLTFVYADTASGFGIELRYTFRPESYVVGVEGRVEGVGAAPTLLVELGPTLAVNEADAREDYRALAYVVNSTADGIRSVAVDGVRGERVEEGPLVWVALKNKYFLAAAVGAADTLGRYFGGMIARKAGREHAADLVATLPMGQERRFQFELYLGPQEPEQLAAVGRGLQDVNPYGWRILRPIIQPLAHFITWALVGMHEVLGLAYGWVLILFGVLVRILLWPLNARAMRAQLKNMELQPRLREIQEKYRNDPERLQREMVRLYKEEGFNPLGGCLPMLIPFPILITLFFVFQNTIEFRGVEFLWIPDLSRADPYYILPIILGGTMLLLQWISMRTTPAPNPQMKVMTWVMPVVMVLIFLRLASGLNLYYAAQNLASVPQQILLTRERLRRQRGG